MRWIELAIYRARRKVRGRDTGRKRESAPQPLARVTMLERASGFTLSAADRERLSFH